MLDSPEVAAPDTSSAVAGLPDYLTFGVEAEVSSPPLPAAEPAPEAGAASPEEQQNASTATGQPSAQPATNAGAPEAQQPESADPELSEGENALLQSQPEAERASLSGKLKAASFMGNYLNPEKPAEEVRQHLEQKSPSRYGELEHAVVGRAISDAARLAGIFRADPEAYGKLAVAAYQSDPAYFLRMATGRDVTPEQLNAMLERQESGIPGAESLTDDEIDDIELMNEGAAEKLRAAREAAMNRSAQAQPEGEPVTPEKVIEQYVASQQTFQTTFEHGLKPVADYVEKRLNSICPEPTGAEWEQTPEVAALKLLKREVLLSGAGGELPAFSSGLRQWGEHRKLGKNGERDFDQGLGRLNTFASKGEREGAAAAATELIPFADTYLNERSQHQIIKAIDSLIALASNSANQPVRIETHIPGSATSQPPSTTRQSLDDYLVSAAVIPAR